MSPSPLALSRCLPKVSVLLPQPECVLVILEEFLGPSLDLDAIHFCTKFGVFIFDRNL